MYNPLPFSFLPLSFLSLFFFFSFSPSFPFPFRSFFNNRQLIRTRILIVTCHDLSRSNCSNKGKIRRGNGDGGPEDDGDYATLRELPLITSLDPADDSTSEENKVFPWLCHFMLTYQKSSLFFFFNFYSR